jgi:hypothetical protein
MNYDRSIFDKFFVYLQIERLCDRLQSATRSEDRRDAVRGLKALSKVRNKLFQICNQFSFD